MSTILVELPLYEEEDYRYSLSLQTVSLQFRFYWSNRASQWHMDIHQEDQTPIVLGHAMVAQFPMLEDFHLETYGLTGHFELMPVNVATGNQLTLEPTVMPQFFQLFYIYTVED